MDDGLTPLIAAIRECDMTALRRLCEAGADLNCRDEHGEPLLFQVLFMHPEELTGASARRELIGTLIDLGADPQQLGDDGGSILIGPIFEQDAAMVELLLARGVDPNHGCCETFETVYDLAEWDYRYEAWIRGTGPALPDARPADTADALAWLHFLDGAARDLKQQRPELLFILRRHGALRASEIAKGLGGSGSESITWRDGKWRLDNTLR